MPRQAIDYSKTIIYKIICDDLPEYIYIGSTTNFRERKTNHKCKSKTSECKLYKTIREHGNWENWKMIEIEEFACENGRQAEKREQHYMDLFKSNLNSYKAFGGETIQEQKKQYNLEHKEDIAKQKKQYHLDHKEDIAEKQKQYRLEHKEDIAKQHKQYYLEHKEHTKETNKQYYLEHKEEIAYKRKEKFICECGSICRIDVKSKHYKTKKHLDFVSNI